MTKKKEPTYTCSDYRLEMILLGLQRRLHNETLSDIEKQKILQEIKKLEITMGMN